MTLALFKWFEKKLSIWYTKLTISLIFERENCIIINLKNKILITKYYVLQIFYAFKCKLIILFDSKHNETHAILIIIVLYNFEYTSYTLLKMVAEISCTIIYNQIISLT